VLEESERAALLEEEGSVNFSPTTLVLDYRYLGSSPIPALTLLETRALTGPVGLFLGDDSCGEVIQLPEGAVFYGKGAGTLVVDDNSHDYYVCPADGPPGLDIHTAYLAKGELFIEIKAFPEARVTRDDILKLAASLLRQMR